jgi:transposase-like protein
MAPLCYRRHRFPHEIIRHAIWLYLRFTLSYRAVEELLACTARFTTPSTFNAHLISRSTLRIFRAEANAEWQDVVAAA